MKKIICFILSICLLVSYMIVPVSVVAIENEAKYEDTTLGGYYKFTFSKNDIYNYSVGAKATYKNKQFTPVNAKNAAGASVGYKQVVDSVTGAKYDTLQIVNSDMVNFTPVTKDGQPYEITPGYDYKVKINMFNPVSNSWVHGFICVGQENPVWANQIEINDGVYNYSNYPYAIGASLSNQGGMGWHYMLKDGTYGKTSKLGGYNGGACLHNTDSRFESSCSHTKYPNASPYISKEQSFSLPVDKFDYDEENMTYSAQNEIYTLSNGSYVPTGRYVNVNNYLSFYLGGGNVSTYAKNDIPLFGNATYDDLYDKDGNEKNNYTVWQIESIEIWETAKGRINVNIGDEKSSYIGTDGTAFDISKVKLPDNKYCIQWYTDKAFTKPLTSDPVFKERETINVYAMLGDAADNATYDLSKENQATLKPIEYSLNGELKSVSLDETGWAYKGFTDEGVVLGKKPAGNAYKWDPSKANTASSHVQINSTNDYIAMETNAEIGKQIRGGWSAYSNYVVRDKNGNAACVQENSRYAIAVTYKKLSEGPQSIAIGIGRKSTHLNSGANAVSNGGYNRFVSNDVDFSTKKVSGEYEVETFYVNVGEFADGDVPVVSVHNFSSGYLVERVAADKNGVKSYVSKADGKTYYPYKIASYSHILIKEVQIIKIDDGNKAATFTTYNKGEGFSATLIDDVPGAVIPYSTNNVDGNWYDTADGRETAFTVFPNFDAQLYTADYYMANGRDDNPSTPIFGSNTVLSSTSVKKGAKNVYALKYNSSSIQKTEDAQVFRIGDVKDGHTYKITMSFKADKLDTNLKLSLGTADKANVFDSPNLTLTKTLFKEEQTEGFWKTLTYYFTADPRGEVLDLEECGMEYILTNDKNSLYLYLGQDVAGKNTVYFTDFQIKDLGEVISSAGTSVLTNTAASSAGHQAIRYYFDYATTNGTNIILDGQILTVVERGFVYTSGALDYGEREKDRVFANNKGLSKKSKVSGFDKCWAYSNGVMTFSTYIKNFAINNDDRKAQVKGYLLVEDAYGEQFYIHSPTVNRTVYGAQNPNNGRRLIWTEEFNENNVSEVKHFTQNHVTMSSSDSNLKTSTSEENYFIDTKTGELVLRITSDGNKNYTTAKSVTTKERMAFKHGYLEMRAKVPYQACVWPSFWLQPDKSNWNKTKYTGEIDIFEVMGNKTRAELALHKWYGGSGSCSSGFGNLHFLDGYNKTSYTFKSNYEATQYHTYGFEWTPEYVAFSIDGKVYCKIDVTDETGDYCTEHKGMDCFHNYYYICLNNWLFTDQNSNWVPASNRVENVADFGTVDYKIDYIRLYQNHDDGLYIY